MLRRLLETAKDGGLGTVANQGVSFAANFIQSLPYRAMSINDEAVEVMGEDWDNLLILDACRYAEFEEINTIEGELKAVISAGSWSWEFMQANFVDRELHDTVYVTANPYAPRLADDVFHAVIPLFDDWDSNVQTIPPQPVVSAARQAANDYPDKRLIVHFMQPHTPFLGGFGRELNSRVPTKGVSYVRSGNQRIALGSADEHETSKTIWSAIRDTDTDITRDDVVRAYRENLELVLDHVDSLLPDLTGKTVITADHGEHLGERVVPFGPRVYGHPFGMKSKELCKVPWLEIDSDSRREVFEEKPDESVEYDDEKVDQRLEALGYK